MAGVVGEVADRVAELFVGRPSGSRRLCVLPDWRVDGAAPARQARDSGVGKRARQSPISASSRAARTRPARGRLVKMCGVGVLGELGGDLGVQGLDLVDQGGQHGDAGRG